MSPIPLRGLPLNPLETNAVDDMNRPDPHRSSNQELVGHTYLGAAQKSDCINWMHSPSLQPTELAKQGAYNPKMIGYHSFTSVYASAPFASRLYNCRMLPCILSELQAAQTAAVDVFHRAFPNGDGGFMHRLRAVSVAESKRSFSPPPLPTVARHERRHDGESFFWVLLWAVVCVSQRRSAPRGTAAIEQFLTAMNNPTPDLALGQPRREYWLTWGDARAFSSLFAQDLFSLGPLFARMSEYLHIPWHLYAVEDGLMPDVDTNARNHVHTALQRFILGALVDENFSKVLNVRSDSARRSDIPARLFSAAFDSDDESNWVLRRRPPPMELRAARHAWNPPSPYNAIGEGSPMDIDDSSETDDSESNSYSDSTTA
ncbi:hypothetical protein AURDEDRAFT_158096 [Auricularia subglabra TFB-10046 SS5]|nr:hypothetical protein AURDEDRAFT_158096 [Auricularia subglabra TFB-10046 SS5]